MHNCVHDFSLHFVRDVSFSSQPPHLFFRLSVFVCLSDWPLGYIWSKQTVSFCLSVFSLKFGLSVSHFPFHLLSLTVRVSVPVSFSLSLSILIFCALGTHTDTHTRTHKHTEMHIYIHTYKVTKKHICIKKLMWMHILLFFLNFFC